MANPFNVITLATAVSSVGDGFALTAFPLLAASLTSDARLIAGLYFFQNLPWLFFAIPAGVVADRHNARNVMIVADLIRGAAFAGVPLAIATGWSPAYALVVLLALTAGTGDTFFHASAFTLVPRVVAREGDLNKANGRMLSASGFGEQLVGPMLGAAAFAFRRGLPFIANGVTFAVSALMLTRVPLALGEPDMSRDEPRATIRQDLVAGLAFFRRSPLLRALAAYITVVALAQSMVFSILVIFARDELGLSDFGFGAFIVLSTVGAVLGGLAADRTLRRFGNRNVLLGGGVVVGLAFMAASLTSSPFLAGVFFSIEGIVVATINVSSLTLRQVHTPPELRGRVANIFRTLLFGSAPFGALIGGFLAYSSGTKTVLLVAGLIQVAAAVVAAPGLSRLLRRAESERETQAIPA